MGFLSKILGESAAAPVKEIGKIIDNIHTSKEEKLEAEQVLTKIGSDLQSLQANITLSESKHRTIFVAGWRPFCGWVCGAGFAINFIVAPLLTPVYKITPPNPETLLSLALAMMGVGTLRTIEKAWGLTK